MEEANSSLGEEFFRGIYSPCGSLATRVSGRPLCLIISKLMKLTFGVIILCTGAV